MGTYWVKKTGSDDTGNGTEGNPYLTVVKAKSQCTGAGPHTIRVGAGTYAEKDTGVNEALRFTASHPAHITIDSEGAGENPIITSSYEGAINAVIFSSTDHVGQALVLKGLTVRKNASYNVNNGMIMSRSMSTPIELGATTDGRRSRIDCSTAAKAAIYLYDTAGSTRALTIRKTDFVNRGATAAIRANNCGAIVVDDVTDLGSAASTGFLTLVSVVGSVSVSGLIATCAVDEAIISSITGTDLSCGQVTVTNSKFVGGGGVKLLRPSSLQSALISLLFTDNIVVLTGGNGQAVMFGSDDGEIPESPLMAGCTIRDNDMVALTGTGHVVGLFHGSGACVLEDNFIDHQANNQLGVSAKADGAIVRRNFIRSCRALSIGGGQGVSVLNNMLWCNAIGDKNVSAFRMHDNGGRQAPTGCTVRHNIIGVTTAAGAYVAPCVKLDDAGQNWAPDLNRNRYYLSNPDGANQSILKVNTDNYFALASARAAWGTADGTGSDGNDLRSKMVSNPFPSGTLWTITDQADPETYSRSYAFTAPGNLKLPSELLWLVRGHQGVN